MNEAKKKKLNISENKHEIMAEKDLVKTTHSYVLEKKVFDLLITILVKKFRLISKDDLSDSFEKKEKE